jgi:hypothetical protein
MNAISDLVIWYVRVEIMVTKPPVQVYHPTSKQSVALEK